MLLPYPGYPQSISSIATWAAMYPYRAILDISDAFYSISVDKDSQKYLGIYGGGNTFYKFTKMPVGLKIGNGIFENYIISLNNKYKLDDFLKFYVDDMVIVGSSQDELNDRIKNIKNIFNKENLITHKEQYNDINFCGLTIGNNYVCNDINRKNKLILLIEDKLNGIISSTCISRISSTLILYAKNEGSLKLLQLYINLLRHTSPITFNDKDARDILYNVLNELKITTTKNSWKKDAKLRIDLINKNTCHLGILTSDSEISQIEISPTSLKLNDGSELNHQKRQLRILNKLSNSLNIYLQVSNIKKIDIYTDDKIFIEKYKSKGFGDNLPDFEWTLNILKEDDIEKYANMSKINN
eukprot:GHVL01026621.1.p1 GENE.GHVL01026621.1~~GHVL01026621.1.p1  ORF type:complete len:355 (+),score=110.21 GHVL01026621.1:411-1475(+)